MHAQPTAMQVFVRHYWCVFVLEVDRDALVDSVYRKIQATSDYPLLVGMVLDTDHVTMQRGTPLKAYAIRDNSWIDLIPSTPDPFVNIFFASRPEVGYLCEICHMWLAGPSQWDDHHIGKKHRKNKLNWRSSTVAQMQKQFAV